MSDRRLAYITLGLGMVAFGGTWPAGKVAAEHVPPAVVAVVRFASAGALLWAWARLSGAPVGRPARRDLPLVLLLGFSVVFAYNLFFLYGVRHAPAADGSVLVPGLIPFVTMLLAWPVLGERPTRRALTGLAVALAGIVIVADPTGGIDSKRLLGDGLFLGAAVAWAVYTLAGRRAIARYGSVCANVYATVCGALLLVPVSFLDGGWSPLVHAPAEAWGAIAYLSVGGTVLGFVAFYEGVRLIGSASASSFALLVPIFGVVSSVLILGESLRTNLAAGGVLVLAGLWLAESRRLHSPRASDRAAVPAPVGDGRDQRHA
ncbi:MAG TPA: DMT family transporter [Gaiellaceae bacterium]|jgi:drug/metabolite transporter (DMT)-like permease